MAGFTSGGDIEHSSGDTFKVEIVSEVGFTEGTTMRLQVSDNEFDTAKINKSFNLTGESFVMSLTSSEEASLTIGNYIYRLTFFDTSGNIITQKSGNFIVKWGVAAGANAADISTLGEKKIIEEIGVLDGKITAEAAARQSADALKADISTTYTKTQVDKVIKTALDGKVDKETGKSLINEDVASHMEHFSSPDDEHNIYVGANLSVGGNIEIGVNKLSTNSTDNIEFYNTITETSSSLQDYLDEKQNKPKSRLIEKIIVGYTLMTVKPSDWDSNYTDYYVNTGTDIRIPVYTQNSNPGWNSASYYRYNADGYTMLEIQPSDWTTKYNTYYEKVGGTYTLVGGTTAPIWETEKYYSVNSTISRNTEPNGTPYNFQKIFYTVDGKSYAGTTKPTYFAAQFLTRTQDYLMYNSGVFGSTLGSAYGTAGCFVKLNEKTYMMLSAQQGNSGVHDATLKGGILKHSYNSAYTDAKLYDGSPIEQFHLYTAANNSGFGFTGGTEIFITAEEAEQEG